MPFVFPAPFSLSLFIFLHFLLFAVCFQRVCVQVRWQWFSICRNSRSQLVLSADQGYLPEPRLPRTPSYPFPSPFPLSDISSFLNGSAPETNAELMLWLTSPATMDAAWTWPQLHWLPHSLTHSHTLRHSHANQYQYVRDVICICVNFPCTPSPSLHSSHAHHCHLLGWQVRVRLYEMSSPVLHPEQLLPSLSHCLRPLLISLCQLFVALQFFPFLPADAAILLNTFALIFFISLLWVY